MIAIEEKKDAAISEIDSFCNVDYEAALCLEDYVIMLLQENNKFNLIGKSTIADIWNRHILDSAQILRFIDDYDKKIADFGSGAGLPGIVISILGAKEVHLIEKSVRKCEFLNKAKIISKNNIFVHQAKLEEVGNIKFDIITSRALASLKDLLMYSDKFLSKDGYCLFLKGKKLPDEQKYYFSK
tara:strand:- start:12 stop:563 length:552 start_codon:yes stop_codon:yes gene_type:complete